MVHHAVEVTFYSIDFIFVKSGCMWDFLFWNSVLHASEDSAFMLLCIGYGNMVT